MTENKIRGTHYETYQLINSMIWVLRRAGGQGVTTQEMIDTLITSLSKGGYVVSDKSVKNKMIGLLKDLVSDKSQGVYVFCSDEKIKKGTPASEVLLTPGKDWRWAMEVRAQLYPEQAELMAAITMAHAEFFLSPPERRDVKQALLGGKVPKFQRGVNWAKKLEVTPRYPPLFLKPVNFEQVEVAVVEALRVELRLSATYIGVEGLLLLRPLKLIRRERVSYVLCFNQHNQVCEYALHRLGGVRVVDDPLPIPAGFDLERARYNSGIKGPWGLLKSSFNFTITGGPAQHLSEMCFHEKHPEFTVIKAIQKNELGRVETVRLEVKNLEYTYEIYCWILGLGSQITVHGPSTVVKHLRGEK